MANAVIERRVDFFGVPVKRTICKEGHFQELFFRMAHLPGLDSEDWGGSIYKAPYKDITVLTNGRACIGNGFVESGVIFALDASSDSRQPQEHLPLYGYKQVVLEGEDIKKAAKGQRRLYGTRITYRVIDAIQAAKLPQQEDATFVKPMEPIRSALLSEEPNPYTPILQRALKGEVMDVEKKLAKISG